MQSWTHLCLWIPKEIIEEVIKSASWLFMYFRKRKMRKKTNIELIHAMRSKQSEIYFLMGLWILVGNILKGVIICKWLHLIILKCTQNNLEKRSAKMIPGSPYFLSNFVIYRKLKHKDSTHELENLHYCFVVGLDSRSCLWTGHCWSPLVFQPFPV